jgi:hypothetical protein
MKILFILLSILAGLIFLFWIGLRFTPSHPESDFSSQNSGKQNNSTFTLPDSLPQPWNRFYHELESKKNQGNVRTAVIMGTARLRISGISLPARFQFIHKAGEAYRHIITVTCFNFPLFTVDEFFLEDEAKMSLPMGVIENEPNVNSAANLALWAEAIWFPTLWVEHPDVSLSTNSDTSGKLTFPRKDQFQEMTFYFDDKTGLITYGEAMRYKLPEDEKPTKWKTIVDEWAEFEAGLLPAKASIRWMDENKPWAVFSVTNVIYNADVDSYFASEK